LTDIAGSTRLWEQRPEAMREALRIHDALAAELIEHSDGVLVKSKGEGDSLFAVFARPSDAITCACALQQRFVSEPWPADALLRVRIALHSGEADLRDGDYYGSTVNRCARLRAIAHGQQVLLSRTTFEMVRDMLPVGASLKDVGEQPLRDLSRPEHVFQLLHPDLPHDFPALKTLNLYPNNLPRQLTSFIGRERDMAEAKRLLTGAPLLTLTGSGGCGKTRLALQVGADLLENFPDGVWFVQLASLKDPALVSQATATVLGVRGDLANTLKSRRLLLILDNCEHLLNACAELVDSLLNSCPQVVIIATSREALGIQGEQTYRVPSLQLPDPNSLPVLEQLTQYESVRLFIDRACLGSPDFAVNNQNAPTVAQICFRLDGIPLAIELAAVRLKALSTEQLAQKLADRFRMLTGGSRTALPRQQTLRATIDWSYDLLNSREQLLLQRLSVFAGGWTLEAAERICSDDPIAEWEVFDFLSSLVDKSLVAAKHSDDSIRYLFLETIREYARERLQESGDAEKVGERHRDYYLEFVEQFEPHFTEHISVIIGDTAKVTALFDSLGTEHDNILAALSWCWRNESSAEEGLNLVRGIIPFWFTRGYLAIARTHLAEALSHGQIKPLTLGRANVLDWAGIMAYSQGDFAVSRTLLEASLEIAKHLGNSVAIINALESLGFLALFEDNLALARDFGEQSLALSEEIGNRTCMVAALWLIGNVVECLEDWPLAHSFYESGLQLSAEIGNEYMHCMYLQALAYIAYYQGDIDHARSLLTQSLRIAYSLELKEIMFYILEGFAGVAVVEHQMERGTRLYSASASLRQAACIAFIPYFYRLQQRNLGAIRAALSSDAFDFAWLEGRTMTLDQVVAFALDAENEE
jgi:predicted ATPase/class 3 adenylate cyclase